MVHPSSDNLFSDQLNKMAGTVDEIITQKHELYNILNMVEPWYVLDSFVFEVVEKAFTGLVPKLHRSGICATVGGKSKQHGLFRYTPKLEIEFAISKHGWRKLNLTDKQRVSKPIFDGIDKNITDKRKIVQILFKDRADEIENWLRGIGNRYDAFLNMYLQVKKGLQPYLNHLAEPAPHSMDPFDYMYKDTNDNREWRFPFYNMEYGVGHSRFDKNGYRYAITGFGINKDSYLTMSCYYYSEEDHGGNKANGVDFDEIKYWILLAPYMQVILDLIKEAKDYCIKWREKHPATLVVNSLKKDLLPVTTITGI